MAEVVVIEDDDPAAAAAAISSQNNEPSDDMEMTHDGKYPIFAQDLAKPRPFLVPSFDGEPVEVLPSEKPNRKIDWNEAVRVVEIENRHELEEYMDIEDGDGDNEDSYEIEIVEDDGDADFYLEIVDGEVYYVFETEDDISVEEEEEDEGSMSSHESDDEDNAGEKGLQLPISEMMAPMLDDDAAGDSTTKTSAAEPMVLEPSLEQLRTVSPVQDEDKAHTSQDAIVAAMHQSICGPLIEVFDDSEGHSDAAFAEVSPASPGCGEDDAVAPSQQQTSASEISPQSTTPSQLSAASSLKTPVSSPVRSVGSATSPRSPLTPPKSILKACLPSPKVAPKPKAKKKKDKGPKEKTFTKTYVRADAFDGEHQVYTWAKPDWTKHELKKTGKGDDIRKGGNLANPITFPIKKPANASTDDDDAEEGGGEAATSTHEAVNKEELIRRITGGAGGASPIALPRRQRGQKKLKFTMHGAKIRDGGDIVKPITKATVFRKADDKNLVANQAVLKSTDTGAAVRRGKDLQAPVTMVPKRPEGKNHLANKDVLKKKGVVTAEKKEYAWEKPTWAKPSLQRTLNGKLARTGSGLDQSDHSKKSIEWEKPEWARRGRRNNRDSDNASLSGSEHSQTKTYEWEKPEWARRPRKYSADSSDDSDDFAIPESQESSQSQHQEGDNYNESSGASPLVTETKKKSHKWEKPDWTDSPQLGETDRGSFVKQGATLANPITFPVDKPDGINKEVQPDEVLKSSDKGDLVRQGESLAKPITEFPDLVKNQSMSNGD